MSVHIDPSVDLGKITKSRRFKRLYELYSTKLKKENENLIPEYGYAELTDDTLESVAFIFSLSMFKPFRYGRLFMLVFGYDGERIDWADMFVSTGKTMEQEALDCRMLGNTDRELMYSVFGYMHRFVLRNRNDRRMQVSTHEMSQSFMELLDGRLIDDLRYSIAENPEPKGVGILVYDLKEVGK